MTDYLSTTLDETRLQTMGVLGLAHIGDAVYELLWRTWLCAHGSSTSKGLHRETILRVCATAQSKAVEAILSSLTETELAVYKRGRNAKVNSVPKHADISDYHAATGLETLFGHLYLKGETDRINQLFDIIVTADCQRRSAKEN